VEVGVDEHETVQHRDPLRGGEFLEVTLASGFRRHAPGGVSLDAKSAFDLEG